MQSENQDKPNTSSLILPSSKQQSALEIPLRLLLASSLILLGYFKQKAQLSELKKIVKTVKNNCQADPKAREELFKYFTIFQSCNTRLCPIMIKEYHSSPQTENEVYKTGMLINGEFEWMQAFRAIREHLKLEAEVSISFFCGQHIISNGSVIAFYEQHKHQDNVLYLQFIKLESYG